MIRFDTEMEIVLKELRNSEWKLSEAQAAGLIFRTIRSFRMRFRRAFGVPYRTFRLRMKLEFARQLLWQTQYSITEIAHRIGYASRRKFDLSFKKHFHETPAQYRERFAALDTTDRRISSQGLYT